MVVCKHWLRGLCKKGDQCSFLHQYDVTRMPECYFYSKFGNAPSWLQALPPEIGSGDCERGGSFEGGHSKEVVHASGGRPGLSEPRGPASPAP